MKLDIKIILDKLQMPKFKAPDPCICAKRLVAKIERDDLSDEEREAVWSKIKSMYEETEDDKLLKILTPVVRKYAQMDNDGVELKTEHL